MKTPTILDEVELKNYFITGQGDQAMSDTPKTLEEQCYGTCWAAQERIAELERYLNAANERVKLLEVAGDLCLDFSFRGMHVIAEKQWRKAKEAKP